jgi:hypothetical protein
VIFPVTSYRQFGFYRSTEFLASVRLSAYVDAGMLAAGENQLLKEQQPCSLRYNNNFRPAMDAHRSPEQYNKNSN